MRQDVKTSPILPVTRLTWFIMGWVTDFWCAWMLMLLMGSLGKSWGYWHAWWVAFTAGSIAASTLYVVSRYLEYMAEHR